MAKWDIDLLNNKLKELNEKYADAVKNYEKVFNKLKTFYESQGADFTVDDFEGLSDKYKEMSNQYKKYKSNVRLLQRKYGQLNKQAGAFGELDSKTKDYDKSNTDWNISALNKKYNSSGFNYESEEYKNNIKSASDSASVFMDPKNYDKKQWTGDLIQNIKDLNIDGLKSVLKNSPKQLKLAGALIVAGVTLFKKAVKSFSKIVDDYRKITNLKSANGTENAWDKTLSSSIKHFDELKTGFKQLKDILGSTVLALAELAYWANPANWGAELSKKIQKDIGLIDESSLLFTSKEKETIKQQVINKALQEGSDSKTAQIKADQFMEYMNTLKSKHTSVNNDDLFNSAYRAVFEQNTSGLQELGVLVNDYALKSQMYKNHGILESSGTTYMAEALSGSALESLQKIAQFTGETLQVETENGVILDKINQNFAWESVEAISAVNTDGGHYNNKGNFMFDDITDALDESADNLDRSTKEMLDFYSSNHSGGALGYNMFFETSGIIMSDRQLMSGFNYNIPDLDTSKNGHNYASRVDVNVKVESDDEKLRAYVKDIAQAETYAGVNNSFTGGNSTTRRSNNRASFNPIL